ncbi:spondin domain-containing protein [Chitinophaga sp. 22321]|uniref:Spondin domain-containing protein n=1 Tax=Chitinophaga hostae TaxID=2831022 RepID=A0ABS5J6U2_9BACT|nr:spondin domain-containing protein [Chitinophaga hostae]MBS0030926.1 spondin domain-containing protein [Chitinophaga hostae]
MQRWKKAIHLPAIALLPLAFAACHKDDNNMPPGHKSTITVENVLNSKPLVQSGTYKGTNTPIIFPGESVNIQFSAAKGETITFASMYGWSNDLFFAPANPGIMLYDEKGMPVEGDVSPQVKLWDNGTRINQAPGKTVVHPGTANAGPIAEVKGADAQGNHYLSASQLLSATLKYNGNSMFTLTLKNISGGTANETPISPGVWAVSYIAGGQLLAPSPLFKEGAVTANGLTAIAEAGDNTMLGSYIQGITGIFTPLSPVLVVIYNGIDNPIYKSGENDRGEGLKLLAQQGNADTLAAFLKNKAGVKAVYVLPAPSSKVLLPVIDGQKGGMVSQDITVQNGDRIAVATMYGFSNDWFFASTGNGTDAGTKGDISGSIALYDDGTAINQFPGAGITQFNLAGTPLFENKPIAPVPNPNGYTTLPPVAEMIRVTLQ